MDIYRLLAIGYSFVIGGTVAVELLLRHLDKADKLDDKTEQDHKD